VPPNERNLIQTEKLPRFHRNRDGGVASHRDWPPAGSGTAGIRPALPVLAALFLLVVIPLGLTGCGHATVPCPTPTRELDRLRVETERLREDAERAEAEEEAWVARKDAAAQRVRDIQARRDSLAAAPSR
jgi:hypothetical protein